MATRRRLGGRGYIPSYVHPLGGPATGYVPSYVHPISGPLAPAVAGPTFSPWKPYKAPNAPPGTYDPNLDISLSAAKRGLADTQGDVATQNTRDTADYLTGLGQIGQAADREGQDYQTRVDTLLRSYRNLANQQGEMAARAGALTGGGAMLQAAAKRQANQALDRGQIDLAHTRAGQDYQTQRDQLALDLAPPSADNPLGGRRFQDRATQLTRAQRETAQFGIDTSTVKNFQAAQTGLFQLPGRGEPGGMPRNEYRDARGNPYRVVVRGNQRFFIDPSGHVLKRRRVGA